MKVSNMRSRNSGREVANQFIIEHDGYTYFQSYQTIIARKGGGETVLDKDYWDYSVTTGKYRNQFLGEGINETRRKIREGIYRVEDLNID